MWVWCLGIGAVAVGGTVAIAVIARKASGTIARVRLWTLDGILVCLSIFGIVVVARTPVPLTASQFSVDGFAVYRQCDSQWGAKPFGGSTVCTDGCGQAAMAMVITALTGKTVTPDQTAAYGTAHDMWIDGSGSSWDTPVVEGTHWGLRVESTAWGVDEVNGVLARGGMVWVCGDKSTPPTTPFTADGHCIAIRGLTSDGKWKVFDSAGVWVNEATNETMRTSDAEYDPGAVIAYSSGLSAHAIYAK